MEEMEFELARESAIELFTDYEQFDKNNSTEGD